MIEISPSSVMQTRAFLFSEKGRKHMFDKIKADIKSVRERDPAVKSDLEVFFLYPSFKAVRAYRRAHNGTLKSIISLQGGYHSVLCGKRV